MNIVIFSSGTRSRFERIVVEKKTKNGEWKKKQNENNCAGIVGGRCAARSSTPVITILYTWFLPIHLPVYRRARVFSYDGAALQASNAVHLCPCVHPVRRAVYTRTHIHTHVINVLSSLKAAVVRAIVSYYILISGGVTRTHNDTHGSHGSRGLSSRRDFIGVWRFLFIFHPYSVYDFTIRFLCFSRNTTASSNDVRTKY